MIAGLRIYPPFKKKLGKSPFLAAVIHKTARLGECMPGNSRVKLLDVNATSLLASHSLWQRLTRGQTWVASCKWYVGLTSMLTFNVVMHTSPWTYEQKMCSTPSRVCYQLVSTWMGDCLRQVNRLSIKPTTKVDSAFHPSEVGKSSIGLSGWC